MLENLRQIFDRDLGRLHTEIEAFDNPGHLWARVGSIANPAGNLCLHLVGNLSYFIGNALGGNGYVRHREAEFSSTNIPKQDLLEKVSQLRQTVADTLLQLTDTDLQKTYPQQVLGYDMTVGYFLLHLLGHLSYHLGQINYIRRAQG